MVNAIQLSPIWADDDRVVPRADHLAGNRPHYRRNLFAIAVLAPFTVFSNVIGHSKTNAIAYILPVAAAEHFVIHTFTLKHERALNRVPSNTAFFPAGRIVDLPIILR